MMILADFQSQILRDWSRNLRVKLEEWKGHKPETLEGFIFGAMHEACSLGYSQAMHEVRSTPWEYVRSTLDRDSMNVLSERGWEPLLIAGVRSEWMIWRRRKGVSDGGLPDSSQKEA